VHAVKEVSLNSKSRHSADQTGVNHIANIRM
jgi:hypothetical protein